MSDGNWWIAPKTEHQWNGKPDLPRKFDTAYRTKRDAYAALELAQTELGKRPRRAQR